MKNYKYDSEIADLVARIMGNGTMVVETINEAILVKYLELRGTPIKIQKSFRDIDKDYKQYIKEEKDEKERHKTVIKQT